MWVKILQQMCQHFFLAQGAHIGGGDVENGSAAGLATVCHLHQGSGASHQDGCGKLGVGIQSQLVLNGLLVLAVPAGDAAADDAAAVGQTCVIPCHLLGGDEMHGGVVTMSMSSR